MYNVEILDQTSELEPIEYFKIKNSEIRNIGYFIKEDEEFIFNPIKLATCKITNDKAKTKEYYQTYVFCDDFCFYTSSESLTNSLMNIIDFKKEANMPDLKAKVIREQSKNYETGFLKCIIA